MNFDDYFNLLKNFSINNKPDDEKETIIFQEIKKDNYEIGVIINKYLNNIFEVYLYIEANSKVCSKLFLREFSEENDSKKYYNELLEFANECTLESIYLRALKEKA